MRSRNIIRIVIITGLILLIPLAAMQFSKDVVWTLSDFIIAGALLMGTGLAYELAIWKIPGHRLAIGATLAIVFTWIWVELAVGLFTSWGS